MMIIVDVSIYLVLVHGVDPQRRFPFYLSVLRNLAYAQYFGLCLPFKSCGFLSVLHDFMLLHPCFSFWSRKFDLIYQVFGSERGLFFLCFMGGDGERVCLGGGGGKERRIRNYCTVTG